MTLPDAGSVSSSPPAETGASAAQSMAPPWHPLTRIAFRFCFAYCLLYAITTQMLPIMLPIPGVRVPDFSGLWPMQGIIMWVGHHVLHVHRPFAAHPTGSGDTAFNWVQTFTMILLATIITAIWSVVARQTRRYDAMYRWFRVFMRWALATSLLAYGLAKAVPLQMPAPGLTRLVEPYGNFSPMGVLWYSIGASRGYEIFVGLAETCAGVLLFIPRTALLGALMALMDTIAVFTLNMTYDVPVKLFAFNLLVFSAILIAPSARDLWNFFIARKPVQLAGEPPVGTTPTAQRVLSGLQMSLGGAVLLIGIVGSIQQWYGPFGGGAAKPPLYGIWNVSRLVVDSQPSPALVTDSTRWRRVLFDKPGVAYIQTMNDSLLPFREVLDTNAHRLTLTSMTAPPVTASFTYMQVSPTQLVFDGDLHGHAAHLDLVRRDPNTYLLRSRGFNWIQEFPFNK
jgi:hypothetical protein